VVGGSDAPTTTTTEASKREILDRRRILQRAQQGTTVLRAALAAYAEMPFDDPKLFTFESWTRVFDALVQDVILDDRGRPTLRWKQTPIALAAEQVA
jgi:hypothetical protein